MDIDKSKNLLDAIKLAPGGHGLYEVVEKTMSLTGLTKEEISKILEPYSEIILRDSPLTEEEINEMVAALLKKTI